MRTVLSRRDPSRVDLKEDEEIVRTYAQHVAEGHEHDIQRTSEVLRRAGYLQDSIRSEQELKTAIHGVYSPAVLQPFKTPLPQVAFCAIFELEWCHAGYTRGEMITTVSLAPDEKLKLEMHSWTKENFQSERELAVESEVNISNSLTARDHLEVVSKMASETSVGVSSSAPRKNKPHPRRRRCLALLTRSRMR